MSLVAISAAYGAAGSQIGPALAKRLEVPFVDRAVTLAVAELLDVTIDDALAHEEPDHSPSLFQRLLSSFVGADAYGATIPTPPDRLSAEDFHRASREALLAQAATGKGVILGRGAVAALRDDPRVMRVRLTGPADRRAESAMALGGIDRETAERALRRFDRAHAEYLRQFYGTDINDPGLYHVTLDATAFSAEFCVELLAQAVTAMMPSPVASVV